MSSHRIVSPSASLSERIHRATAALTKEQIRKALPEKCRHVLDGDVGVEMIHLSRPLTSGHRAALYAEVDVSPVDGPNPGTRSSTHVLVSWTFHGADELPQRPHKLLLEIDRLTPVVE